MAVEVLRKHRILQLKERREAGSAWVESGLGICMHISRLALAARIILRWLSPIHHEATDDIYGYGDHKSVNLD